MGESLFRKKLNRWIKYIKDSSAVRKQVALSGMKQDGKKGSSGRYAFGWSEPIRHALDYTNGIMLTGPDGCGKHTAADIAAAELAGRKINSYEVLYLSGRDFVFSEADISEFEAEQSKLISSGEYVENDIVQAYLDALCGEYFNDKEFSNICIVLEEADKSTLPEELYLHLGNNLMQFSCDDDFPELFVVLIEQNEGRVPGILRRQLLLMRMTMPNEQQRFNQLVYSGIDRELAFAVAANTGGCTYAQLSDIAENIKVYRIMVRLREPTDPDSAIDRSDSKVKLAQLFSDAGVSSENELYQELVFSQLPEMYSATSGEGALYDKSWLYRKIGELIDIMPQLIEKMGQPGAVSYIPAPAGSNERKSEKAAQEDTDYDKQQKKLEAQRKEKAQSLEEESRHMTIEALLEDVMGEERMGSISGTLRERQ